MAILVLAMSPVAAPLWKLPVLGAIQFPWRLLTLASVSAAVAGGYCVEALSVRRALLGWAGGLCLVAALLLLAAPRLTVEGYYPNRPQMYSPANTRRNLITTNINEFRPIWVKEGPSPDRLSQGRILDGQGHVLAVSPPARLLDVAFRLTLATPQAVTYEAHYFPGWRVWCDGKPLAVQPSSPRGLVSFEVAAGQHTYRIRFGSTPTRRSGAALSGLGLTLLAGWGLAVRLRKTNPAASAS